MTCRKKTHADLFKHLDKYMLSVENVIKFSNIKSTFTFDKKLLNKSTPVTFNKEVINNSAIFYPRQQDLLFWCFYIIYKGDDLYHQTINHVFRTEKDMKIRTIEILAGKRELMKTNKLKRIEIENELLNEKKITLKGLKALCLAYDVSICLVKGCVFYEFDFNKNNERGIIIHNDKIGVYTDHNSAYYNKIVGTHYQITNATKPINAISGYTLGKLQDICKQLNLPIINCGGVKLNKKDLYMSIQSQL
tara:strand:- start:251 stop:994 length:744 start_codon:yes stop_codon:yes gene_type:complete